MAILQKNTLHIYGKNLNRYYHSGSAQHRLHPNSLEIKYLGKRYAWSPEKYSTSQNEKSITLVTLLLGTSTGSNSRMSIKKNSQEL